MMNFKRLSLVVALASIVAGCSMPPMQGPQVVDRNNSNNSATVSQNESPDSLLAKAAKAQPIEAAKYTLAAARRLIELGDEERAKSLLADIDTSTLPPSLRFDILSLQTRQAIDANDPDQALSYLAYMPALSTLPEEDVLLSEQLYAEAFDLNGQALDQAKTLIESTRYVHDEAELQNYHNQIWSALQQVSDQSLYQALQDGNSNYNLQGWLELAKAARQIIDVNNSTTNIENWLAVWQAHPAAQIMPQDLMRGGSESLTNVGKIAVMLPSEGNLASAAKAIRVGIERAHQAASQVSMVPELVFIDSSQLLTAQDMISAAQNQGAQMVVGPLDKTKVSILAENNQLPLPFLALNYVEQSGYNLFQFGLSPEDEARDAATTAYLDGKYSALVMVPNTEWGQRSEQAFREAFSRLGGTVVDSLQFETAKLSNQIPQLLRVDKGRLRANEQRRRDKKSFSFANVRRKDADVILMAANPQDARLIKPFLKYYFADNIPAYATSLVYSGSPNAKMDVDLNGLRFGDIPWMLEAPSSLQRSIASQHSDARTRYGRLYAMGIDAFNIYPYLQQLSMTSGAQFQGETGKLSISADNRVQRHMTWAIFSAGVPKLLEQQ
jgi:outer membrane PBP1 activator LpoA protein